MRYSDGHSPACSRQGLCGNVLYQPLDSSFRWNDEGVLFRLYVIPACLPQTGSCHFLHTQSTCNLNHLESKRAFILDEVTLIPRHEFQLLAKQHHFGRAFRKISRWHTCHRQVCSPDWIYSGCAAESEPQRILGIGPRTLQKNLTRSSFHFANSRYYGIFTHTLNCLLQIGKFGMMFMAFMFLAMTWLIL